MEHIFNHLVQRLIPLLLLPVVFSGLCFFGLFQLASELRSFSKPDWIVAIVVSLMGILGTGTTYILLRAIRRQASSWRVLELGRMGWIVLVCLAWVGGVACGFIMMYDISQ